MRRDLEEIVAAVTSLRTRRTGAKPDIGLTTNGLGLDRRAAGLRSVCQVKGNHRFRPMNHKRFYKGNVMLAKGKRISSRCKLLGMPVQ